MTKKIISFLLIMTLVLVPSISAVSAVAGDEIIVTQAMYNQYRKDQVQLQKPYTFIVNGAYNYKQLLPSEYESEQTILNFAKNQFEKPNVTVISVTKNTNQSNVYTVVTSSKYPITLKYKQIGNSSTALVIDNTLLPNTYDQGTTFTTVFRDLLTVKAPIFPGFAFMTWRSITGFDSLNTVNGPIVFEAEYRQLTPVECDSVAYYAGNPSATEIELTTGYYTSTYSLDNYFGQDGVLIPKGSSNILEYSPKTGDVANANSYTIPEYITKPNGTYFKFSGWRQVNGLGGNVLLGTAVSNPIITFVATYEKVSSNTTYKYTLDFANVINPQIGYVTSSTLSQDYKVLLDTTQIKAIEDAVVAYNAINPNSRKVFAGFTMLSGSGYNFTLRAVYNDLKPTVYYYFDLNGNPTTSVEYHKTNGEEYTKTVPNPKNYTFKSWKYNSVSNSYDAIYTENGTPVTPPKDDDEDDDKPTKLPDAKNGANSFAFASTLKGTVGYKKSVTLRVTAGSGTFTKAQISTVNKATSVIFTGLNCTAKAGKVSTTTGKTVNVTFNKKGTAYVVASVMYNGKQYVKTFTKTIK